MTLVRDGDLGSPSPPENDRKLKRRLTHFECQEEGSSPSKCRVGLDEPVPTSLFPSSGDGACAAPRMYGLMEPPSGPPPFKRANSGAQALISRSSCPSPSPSRPLTPRISWSDIAGAAGSQGDSSQPNPSTPTPGSPQTPVMRMRAPPSPQLPLRRRPPSGDHLGEESADRNEGRFARDFADVGAIGTGQFSTVYRARNRLDNHVYAVKKTLKISGRGERPCAEFREIFALAAVSAQDSGCVNIVRYFSSWVEDGCLHIQTELCSSGSLRDLAARCAKEAEASMSDPRFEEKQLVEALRDVATGLTVLHGRGFAHMDVKPDNVLLGPGPSGDVHKLADLGLAAAALGSSCDDISEGDCRYLAREVMRGNLSQLPKADVFSLGVLAYELATNPRPLPCNGAEWQDLRDGKLNTELLAPTLQRVPLFEFLCRMVSEDPSVRPSCEEILRHPSLAPVDRCASALQEERNQRLEAEKAAEKSQKMAKEYFQEILSMKRRELLQGMGKPAAPAFSSAEVRAASVSGRVMAGSRSVAVPKRRASADW